ncbi:hypothetical protein T484DRAFT_1785488 [Baffinella frigidus]|nr:hypothetical protein T484DRAFT_1785488 [Cryptophyta sp. CCMP2293]
MINSVSLFSDGAHNLADAGAFAIALAANHYAQHHTDLEESRRMQIMGGLLNVSICLILTLFAGVEAWKRFFDAGHMEEKRLFDAGHMEEKAKIDGAYLAIAVCGILINGFGAMFLGVSSLQLCLSRVD